MDHHASMNRIYRLVWSDALDAYVAAAETSRGRGRRGKRRLLGAALLLAAAVAHAGGPARGPTAGPSGGLVTAGSATVSQSGGTTTIAQSSQNLSLNWQSFNIGAQQTVDFLQPDAAAIAVNRILGSSGSVILGHLNANGQVYLINPNGVLFGRGAEVNVGGLVASTLELNDSTLGDASKRFSGTAGGHVVNDGTLTAAVGGSIALLGNRVSNSGVISAQLGSVALGAGSAATLRFSGTHLVSMQVDQCVLNSVAANGGLIRADGGQVLMTAGANKALLASVVNNTGIIEARTLEKHAGTITLLAGMTAGTVDVGGTLDASAPNGGSGGSIETSAAAVRISHSADVTTAAAMGLSGSWLIDPTDFAITAGTTAQSASGIGATTLQGELTHGNVAIATSASGSGAGDINIDAPVSWSANALSLTAANDINVNAVMTVSGSARVAFEPGSGNLVMGFAPDGSFAGRVDISSSAANALSIGGQVYTIIHSLGAQGSTTATDLQGINGNLAGYYALGSSLDASVTSGWNAGAGFTPIGSSGASNFTGAFDGLGHTISGLTINQPSADNLGFFGWIGATGAVRNVGLLGGSIQGLSGVGALAGANYGRLSVVYASTVVSAAGSYAGGLVGTNLGAISNSGATGAVSATTNGTTDTGGLAGYSAGPISASYATGAVSGFNNVGGLVGYNAAAGTISTSHAFGNVTGTNGAAGGLVGTNYGAVTSTHATGTVNGVSAVGGLIGANGNPGMPEGTVTDSYATGAVTGVDVVGGLVGYNVGAISYGYARGDVSGEAGIGGLVGFNLSTLNASFATGTVTATGPYAGGLVGLNQGAVTQSFATGAVNGAGAAGGLIGLNAGSISIAFASGAVTGSTGIGGLVGANTAPGTITSAYATGAVSGASYVGGLVGNSAGMVDKSYATGSVTGGAYSAGLVGQSTGTITNSFYDISSNPGLPGYFNAGGPGSDTPGALAGLTTAQLQTQANFTSATAANGAVNPGWDFGATWMLYEGHTAPLLQVFMTPLTVSGTLTQTYTGAVFAPAISQLTYSLTPDLSQIFGTVAVAGSATGALHVGTYSFTPGGLYSDQLGYILSYNAGALIITPATLTVSGTRIGSKVYNGTTVATLTGGSLVGLVGGDTLTLTQAGSFASKNVGTGIAVSANDSIAGANADDYILVDPAGLVGTITPALITVSGTTAGNKVYDGTTIALLSGGSLVGLIGGDSLALNQSGMFASSGPGTGIAVTATDSLSGANAGDYSLVQPTGLTASILAADGAGSSDLLAAVNARTQIVENFIYPQWGATPQVIDVSMTISAYGTLKIEGGGLRLPANALVGQ
jgi:filamentous hemagglutinin family protein